MDDLQDMLRTAASLRSAARVVEARAAYAAVLARDPACFEAGFATALLDADAGAWTAADAWLSRLRQHRPDRPDLRWLSARIAAGLGEHARAADELRVLAREPALSEAQRADVLLLLSQALDAQGAWPEAFAAAAEGKALQRRLYAARAASREGAAARLRRLDAWFGGADPAPWRTAPAAPDGPASLHLFLVGFPRSGTTLLEQAFAGHPQVVALEEAPTLAAAHAEFLADAEGLQRLARLSPADAARWRKIYWAEVRARGVEPEGRVFLDKAPAATEDLPLVAKLFPGAKVLFAVRDPRDVVLSCFRQNFQMNALTYAFTDLAAAAEAYDGCMALAETYRRVLPLDVVEIRHEALLADFEAGLRRLCGAVGLPFHPAMADPAGTARRRDVLTPSAPQVRAGLNAKGLGRWRAYAAELAPALPALEPWVRRFGYA